MTGETHKASRERLRTAQAWPPIVERLNKLGFTPEKQARPTRCRAILFTPDGQQIVGMHRERPGREPYVVYPGGHLDVQDPNALDGLIRELGEELSLTPSDYRLTGKALEFDDQYFFLGVVNADVPIMRVAAGAPEALADPSVLGSYAAGYYGLDRLIATNFLPEEITHIIVQQTAGYN